MPIPLGILAAAGVRPTAGGTYELIETINVGSGGAASVTFSNLNTYSTTYQHLQIRAVARTSSTSADLSFRLNGDTASNYSGHSLYGFNGSVSSGSLTSQTAGFAGFLAGSDQPANAFTPVVLDLLDVYEAKNKTIRSLSARATAIIALGSGLWMNTASLTSVTLLPASGSFVQYSRFSIYGLKAS